ncbi:MULTISPECIES: Bug family tripartite tricarboxylate transporter substrate binding protein [Ramlibacter]|uniref:Tripartite tricarboxylate transporter substrate binding protein n=1 Tax=Ramlibacter pinisoli TaxID=2682844 RepID=A0A6N8IVA8_9BURK|nr:MULTISPECIES: tripartite tricarboxylate transporter substrate binding protein [Ramlibacter]MBA2965105.1 tripartite tricarboxylate transporter substrate binding protein [Ramlibacter sp. CGMCC 1.13660]MVQ30070.1 tripartite tricarboxylate transporter substrate binding protein [Ramlibacter pinisoli]
MARPLDRRQLLVLAAAAAAAASSPVFAQAYPNKAVRIVVPQPPGGGFDSVGRLLADRLGKQMGQGFVVENRAGSGTLVGTDLAAKAAPDGYTLLVGSVSNLALNPGLYPNLPYDSLKDFEPIGLAVSYSYTLMARKDLPFRTLQDVVAYAKANPGRLLYASAGNGSGQHVLAAALWHLAGVEITHVPYRGAQPAYQDLLGGRVDLFFDLSPTARVQVDAGNARALAVSGPARNPMHPDVPTVLETRVAQLELESWFGLFAPARTPADVLARLREAFGQVVAAPELGESLAKGGGKPLQLTGEAARAVVRRDVERWAPLVRTLGVRAD